MLFLVEALQLLTKTRVLPGDFTPVSGFCKYQLEMIRGKLQTNNVTYLCEHGPKVSDTRNL